MGGITLYRGFSTNTDLPLEKIHMPKCPPVHILDRWTKVDERRINNGIMVLRYEEGGRYSNIPSTCNPITAFFPEGDSRKARLSLESWNPFSVSAAAQRVRVSKAKRASLSGSPSE